MGGDGNGCGSVLRGVTQTIIEGQTEQHEPKGQMLFCLGKFSDVRSLKFSTNSFDYDRSYTQCYR